MPDLDHLKAEADELYARARQIEDENERLAIISRALELEMAAAAQVIRHHPGGERT